MNESPRSLIGEAMLESIDSLKCFAIERPAVQAISQTLGTIEGDFWGRKCDPFLVKEETKTNVAQLRCGIVTKRVKHSNSTSSQPSCLDRLSKSLKCRLQPSEGARPGRPSDPTWNQYGKLPMSDETAQLLGDLASHLSSEDRKISPMQVAAHLLELQLKKYSVSDLKSNGTVSRCA